MHEKRRFPDDWIWTHDARQQEFCSQPALCSVPRSPERRLTNAMPSSCLSLLVVADTGQGSQKSTGPHALNK